MHIVASYLATDKTARIAFIIMAVCGIAFAIVATFREGQEYKRQKEIYDNMFMKDKTIKKDKNITSK